MSYPLRKHEVDRLAAVVIAMGWTLEQEMTEPDGVKVVLKRTLSPELLAAEMELEKLTSPQ